MITDDSETFWLDNLESEVVGGAYENSGDLVSTFIVSGVLFFFTVCWKFGSDGNHFIGQEPHSDTTLCPCSCLTALFTSHDTHHRFESNSVLGLGLFNMRAHTDMPSLYLDVFNGKVEWEAVSKVSDRSSDNGDLL
jgi:hypothetical protein